VKYEDFFLTKKKKIDVLLHELVPKHQLLTKEETKQLLNEYKIMLTDLPQMFEKDPVAIAIGAKEGDVVRIIRNSHTTVSSVNYYRYVKKEKV
jgi:DNA-directed RNA polymerase subunit H